MREEVIAGKIQQDEESMTVETEKHEPRDVDVQAGLEAEIHAPEKMPVSKLSQEEEQEAEVAEITDEETQNIPGDEGTNQDGEKDKFASKEKSEEDDTADMTEEPVDHDESAQGEPVAERKEVPYHERYYLKYKQGRRSTPLDLTGTKKFLWNLGFDGGELRQARMGKKRAEEYRNSDKKNQMYCSYCGTEISGVEFYRLPDGRLRCTACSNSVVKTKAEVEEICKRVISNMETFFGASINVPVSVEVVDERKIKRKIGVTADKENSQNVLILGFAANKKGKYSIVLENGAPRISLIATFVHELTHIWQYIHWDNNKALKKCADSKRQLIYEGMAKWAEIQYLYLIGETNVARREEYITMNRKDEYGLGFCLYADRYPIAHEAMTCEESPFTPDKYPFN